jgi:RNA polymerase sigma factor (sigma-70 family)
MEEPDLPRPKGDAASRLATEDLGPYSQAELDTRIAQLEAEIARVSGLGENLVVSALDAMRSTRSIDAPLSGEEDASGLRELLQTQEEGPYSTELEDVSLARGLGEALERLSERERSVIALRFGLQGQREHTLSEVADHMGVSLERVRQIQMRAITKLRTPGLRKVVDPYLNN